MSERAATRGSGWSLLLPVISVRIDAVVHVPNMLMLLVKESFLSSLHFPIRILVSIIYLAYCSQHTHVHG